jgi:hypothetical protein
MLPDGERNSPPAAVCMGMSAGVLVAAGAVVAIAAGADDAVVVLAVAPTAADVPELHADKASPAPRPSMPIP